VFVFYYMIRFRALGKEDKRFVDVIRGGDTHNIRTSEVVVGDIVVLSWGKFIPADGYIISSDSLKVVCFLVVFCRKNVFFCKQTGGRVFSYW
jgi:hypothetical protein